MMFSKVAVFYELLFSSMAVEIFFLFFFIFFISFVEVRAARYFWPAFESYAAIFELLEAFVGESGDLSYLAYYLWQVFNNFDWVCF